MTMEYFWETSGSIVKGVGFKHFSPLHLAWIAFFLVSCIVVSFFYRKCGEVGRKRFRFTVGGLIILSEILKTAVLLATGLWTKNYLPLHLCPINVFLVAVHMFKPTKTIDNFLYTICIPAAIMAILFPTWTKLPFLNFMHIRSFLGHILLVLYPLMLTVGGDIKPRARLIPKCLLLLVGMAIPVGIFNYFFDTNYMFLMEAEKGNPLYWFAQNWGNHLLGFPVLLAAVLIIMYAPIEIYRLVKRKKTKSEEKTV